MRELHRLLLASESRELAEEIAHLFDDISRSVGHHLAPGETAPALDVLETDSSVEIEIDVPGVGLGELRVVIKNGVVIVAGEKLPRDSTERADGSFHLVERGFGHFARAVRLTGAFDGAAARATLQAGELRIVIPKIRERRGGEISVPIVSEDAPEGAVTDAGAPPDHA